MVRALERDRFAAMVFLLAGVLVVAAALTLRVRPPTLDDGESYSRVFSDLPPLAYHIVRPGETVAAIILLAHGAICVMALTRVPRPAGGIWPAVLAVHWWLWWSELCRDWRFVDGLARDPLWQAVRLAGIAIGALLVARALRFAVGAPEQFRSALADLRGRRCTRFYVAAWGVSLAALAASRWPILDPPGYFAVWLKALAAVWFLMAVRECAAQQRRESARTPLAPPGGPWRGRLRTGAAAAVFCTLAQAVLWVQYPLPALHAVVPGKLYRSGLPGAWGLRLAQYRYGFSTIVGMRTEGLPEYEHRFSQRHAIRLINPQRDATFTPYDFVDLMSDPEAGPVLVHCNQGVNRTGSWITAYRHLAQGWPVERGLAEAEQTSGRPVRQATVDWLRELFPESLAARGRKSQAR